MIKAAILFAVSALTLAALVAKFAPMVLTVHEFAPMWLAAPAEPPRPAAAAAPGGAPAQESPAERPNAGYREAEIAADARGQYGAEALVDGMPVRVMIDTGASVVALSTATAARLGLVPGRGPKWMLKTANGQSSASPVTLDSVSFGGLYMRDVEAVILAPEAGEVNLLGASFLRRLISVEQRDGMLILRQ